jgi:23S rRNA (cytidine1920-2'-O)/16S rRNA (cytidine1409-2'-O)-methyltransferase
LNKKKNLNDRIDKVLVELGIVSTRARAQAMIIAGHVLMNDEPVLKPGTMVSKEANFRLREPELKYVSRGALKLKKAIEHFQIKVTGKIALDVGASTGGFTEILLEYGAEKVHAIDVGTNQLAWKIRSDPRVEWKENYNARYLEQEDFNRTFDIMVMDVSFISIKLILPALQKVMKQGTELVVLFKPQFEVGKEWIEDGGIVRNQDIAQSVMNELVSWAEREVGLAVKGMIPSPILGTDGNHEYLIHWIKQ